MYGSAFVVVRRKGRMSYVGSDSVQIRASAPAWPDSV